MKFRELLNEEEAAVETKPLLSLKEKFKKDVLDKEDIDEGSMPPGFSKDNIQTTDEFIKSEKTVKDIKKDIDESKEEEDDEGELEDIEEGKYVSYTFEESKELDEAVDDAETSDIDIDKLKKTQIDKKAGGKDPEKGVEVAKKQAKMLHASNIIDDDGNPIDNDKLMAKMTVRPKELIGQNSKLGKSGNKQTFYDLTLPAYQGLYVDEKSKTFKVIKTCPSAGECSKFCYASKGGYIMFPASGLNASRVVTYLMNHYDEFKAQLESELKTAVSREEKKGNKVVLRWHDSGDFISPSYLKMVFDIAKATPEVLHYAYTKQIPLVKAMEADKPDNFEFTYSFGGVHDEKIDTVKERHARVVPHSIFKDLPFKKGPDGYAVLYDDENTKKLKEKVAEHFKVSVDTIITYDELMKMKEGTEKKWHVLVWKGHGDDSPTRKDVLGVYLLFH